MLAVPDIAFGNWWPVVMNALLFVYVGWSADAMLLFGPPTRGPSATELLTSGGDEFPKP